jgi:hypothetical protein
MSQSTKQHELDVIERYSPYFDACGIDSRTWNAWTLFDLVSIIWNDAAVRAAESAERADYMRLHRKPTDGDWTAQDYLDDLHQQGGLLLQAVRELPAANKADLKACVLARRKK